MREEALTGGERDPGSGEGYGTREHFSVGARQQTTEGAEGSSSGGHHFCVFVGMGDTEGIKRCKLQSTIQVRGVNSDFDPAFQGMGSVMG